MCEGHHHRSSHHSNGLIRFNVHLNQLKWNESLMKRLSQMEKLNLLLTKEHSSTRAFNSFEVNPKSLSAFLKEGGIYSRQPTSATMHFSFQLGKPWSAIIFSYFPVFSCSKRQFSLQLKPWVLGQQNKSFYFKIWQKHQLVCSLANILRKVFYWECLECWKFKENCPIIWGSKISIESLFFCCCCVF